MGIESKHLEGVADVVVHLSDFFQARLQQMFFFFGVQLALQEESSGHETGENVGKKQNVQTRDALTQQNAVKSEADTADENCKQNEDEQQLPAPPGGAGALGILALNPCGPRQVALWRLRRHGEAGRYSSNVHSVRIP